MLRLLPTAVSAALVALVLSACNTGHVEQATAGKAAPAQPDPTQTAPDACADDPTGFHAVMSCRDYVLIRDCSRGPCGHTSALGSCVDLDYRSDHPYEDCWGIASVPSNAWTSDEPCPPGDAGTDWACMEGCAGHARLHRGYGAPGSGPDGCVCAAGRCIQMP